MKRIPVIILLICLLTMSVSAYDPPDINQTGSISITLRYEGKPVSGGEMTLYRVGDIQEDDGNYSFVLTEQFYDSGVLLESVTSPESAKQLADYALRWGIEGVSGKIGDTGSLKFGNLQPGLYLLVQPNAAPGYRKLSPFLVSLPMAEPEGYSYHVEAGPKVSPVPEWPEQTQQPETGQSLWPIWLFGLSAVALAAVLCHKKRFYD